LPGAACANLTGVDPLRDRVNFSACFLHLVELSPSATPVFFRSKKKPLRPAGTQGTTINRNLSYPLCVTLNQSIHKGQFKYSTE
jgi:hypothetical protein